MTDDDEATNLAARLRAEANLKAGFDVAAIAVSAPPPPAKKYKSAHEEEAKRQARLESNRKAAQESRRRKKLLVEELQRSVIFFTRANAQLRKKNDSLMNMLLTARNQIGNKETSPSRSCGSKGITSTAGATATATVTGGEQQRQQPITTTDTTTPAAVPGGKDKATPSGREGGVEKDEKTTATPTAVAHQAHCADTPAANAAAVSQDAVPQASSLSQLNNSNCNAQMMANWLALAQVQAQQAAAAGINYNVHLGGMVPNPMLPSPTTTLPVMFNPKDNNMAAALRMHPNYHCVQQHQQVSSLPSPPSPATTSAMSSAATGMGATTASV